MASSRNLFQELVAGTSSLVCADLKMYDVRAGSGVVRVMLCLLQTWMNDIAVVSTPFSLSGHLRRNYSNLNWRHLKRGRYIAVDILRNLVVVFNVCALYFSIIFPSFTGCLKNER